MPPLLPRPRLLVLAPAVLLGFVLFPLLAPPPAAQAGLVLPRQTYRDPVHKFSFKIFDKWAQVPVEAGEKIRVARFMKAGAPRGRGFTPSLTVVRINTKAGGDAPTITGPNAEAYRRAMEARNPKSAWDATVGRLRLPIGFTAPKDDFKAVKSKDKVPGRMWRFEFPFGSSDNMAFVFLAVFEKEGIEYGLFFTSLADRRKSYERGLERLAKSFRFYDGKAKDVKSLGVLEGVNISAERRRQIERTLVKGWDVIVSPKKQYVVIYNTKRNKNNLLAKEIAHRIEMIRAQIYEKQFPPVKPILAVSIVRVCGDKKEYHEYGGPGGSAGYWNSGSEELVFYDASPAKKIDDNTVSVLYHEAFHQYIFYSTGDIAPHSWFNEGHGDYYAGASLKGRRFTIKPFRWRRGLIKNAVAKGPRKMVDVEDGKGNTVKRYANDGGYTPLKDFVRFTQREYYSYPGICYAQGWSFIYFLREIVPKNRKYKAKWGHILQIYFDSLKGEVDKRPKQAMRDRAQEDGGDDDPSGDGDDGGEDGGGDEKPPADWVPPPPTGRRGGRAALEQAVKSAFDGVDFDELQAAWVKAVKHEM